MTETFVDINSLDENSLITFLRNRVFGAISNLTDRRNNNIVIFLKSQGVGKRLVRESVKSLNKQYGVNSSAINGRSNYVLKHIQEFEPRLNSALFQLLRIKYGDRTFYEYELLENVLDKNILDVLCLYSEFVEDESLTFNRRYYVFYKKDVVSMKHLVNTIEVEMPTVISIDEYNSFSLFKKRIVNDYWFKSTKNKYYLRKNTTELDLAIITMSEEFPKGYHIQKDYDKLCQLLKEKYGELFSCPSNSVVTWKLQHFSTFCQVDRGMYALRSKCPGLDLIEQSELISYIRSQGDIVYYSSILEHFKDEFKDKGITNQYYAKGIVDHYIEGYGYETNRDFIKKEGSPITGKQAIVNKALSYESAFNLSRLRNDFPGVKDYSFQVVLYECGEFINLGDSNYVSLGNSGVTSKGEDLMISVARETIESRKGIPVIAKKVLTKIKLFSDDWKKDLGHITTSSALFSFLSMSERANQIFEFKRPYFALKGANKEEMNFRTSLFKSLSSFDEITNDIVRKTIVNLGITRRHPINFMDVFEEMSDEYLLVDRFKLLRISKLYIQRDEIDMIKTKVFAVLSKKKVFESKLSTNFKSFPKEIGGLQTNEYLILGIVSTYLQNCFDYEINMRGAKLAYSIKEA